MIRDATIKTRIDIYVDGSWLNRGKNNPAEAGGWGAVIVASEAGRIIKSWKYYGEAPKNGKAGTVEATAALRGLEKTRDLLKEPGMVLPAPKIFLHSDKIELKSLIENSNYTDPSIRKIGRLARELDAEITATHASKTTKKTSFHGQWMNCAHELASTGAYQARLEKQGYIGLAGSTKRREGTAATSFIDQFLHQAEKLEQSQRGL